MSIKKRFYLKAVLLLGLGYFTSFPAEANTDSRKSAGKVLQALKSQQSPHSIIGNVQDENGERLIGVSVFIKQKYVGTITDERGRYRINATPGDILVFSCTGFNTMEYKIDNQTLIDVVLTVNHLSLDEVVVTGYQTLSKERATGSFDRIKSEQIATRLSSDISSTLQGLIPGMKASEHLNGSMSFTIRGNSTFYADKYPLLVVDGFPIQGSFNTINPNDVESVTILKDAAAASIWGSRSANGVIVITTKKGKKEKLKVDIRGFYQFANSPNLNETWALADSRTQVDYELDALKNGWTSGADYTPSFANIGKELTLAQELYYANKYLGLSEQKMNEGLEKLRNTNNHKQIKKHLLQPQVVQQYNASISGGGERSSNYLSLMYEKRDENTIKRGYNRYLINFNNTYRISSSVSASFSVNLQKTDTNRSGFSLLEMGLTFPLSPYELILNEDNSYAANIYKYNRYEQSQLPLYKFPYEDWSYNILREIRGRDYKTTDFMYRIQGGLNIKLMRAITLDTRIQYESNVSDTKNYNSEDTFYVRDMVNSRTEYNPHTKEVGVSRVPKGGIELSYKNKYYNYVFRNQVNFNKSFNVRHEVSALAGIEISEYNVETINYPYAYGYYKETNTTAVPPYGYGGALAPFKDFLGKPARIPGGGTNIQQRVDRYLSYYGNVGYTYNGKYSASFSIRADGSNFVSDNPALRWSPMWSAGIKWNASKEPFFKDIAWIDRCSLRITYGINGNAEKSTSPLTLISMAHVVSNVTNTQVANVNSLGNPKLRWEKTYTTNLGVDFDLLKCLSGKIELYTRNSKDVVAPAPIAAAHGTGNIFNGNSQKFNNAEISNKGIELLFAANISIPQANLKILSTVVYAYNKNKVTKLYKPSYTPFELVMFSSYVKGRPVGSIHSYRYAGMENGVPYIYGVDGVKNSMNDFSFPYTAPGLSVVNYSGTVIPPHTLGWTNKFTYKNLSLSVYITGNFGGVFRAPTLGSIPPVGSGKMILSRYIKDYYESDGSLRPAMPLPGEIFYSSWGSYVTNLEHYVENASFIRLKEITLEYNVPQKMFRNLWLKNARIYAQLRDLGLIYTANKYGYDPEWLPGIERPCSTISFGASLSF